MLMCCVHSSSPAVLCGITEGLIQCLQAVQNAAACLVTGRPRSDFHSSDVKTGFSSQPAAIL